jgi:acetoin:2,6-dichlorophenolindophenol oxidoreductase subunit alpha
MARSLPDELAWSLLETMLLIRRFEENVLRMSAEKHFVGHYHLYIGQEATGAAVMSVLGPRDRLNTTHRNHGHVLARGADPGRAMAEILGRATGLNGGRGGTIHLSAPDLGFLSTSGIVGGCISLGVGGGYACKQKKDGSICATFFGDGALEEGVSFEALNIASLWKLPVLFICENNFYMEYTPIGSVTAVPHPAADRAPAYGLAGEVVDGNDVVVVRDAVARAAERARGGGGPALLEAQTYRHFGHSRTDPAKYRPAGEVEEWLRRDPLGIARERLEALGVPADAIARADEEARAEVDAAVDEAKNAPDADPGEALTDVWAD